MEKKIDYGIAVDGWCSGNPGRGGYKGIDIKTGKKLFEWSTDLTTNNLVEYLAIIHAYMYQKKYGYNNSVIWSDSTTAISWINKNKCKTKLDLDKNIELKIRINKSYNFVEKWGKPKVFKWNTKKWGDIPADFGNK